MKAAITISSEGTKLGFGNASCREKVSPNQRLCESVIILEIPDFRTYEVQILHESLKKADLSPFI